MRTLPPGDAAELNGIGLGSDSLGEGLGLRAVEQADLLRILRRRIACGHWHGRGRVRRRRRGVHQANRIGPVLGLVEVEARDIAPDAVAPDLLLREFDFRGSRKRFEDVRVRVRMREVRVLGRRGAKLSGGRHMAVTAAM
jgi:hypothetical protein